MELNKLMPNWISLLGFSLLPSQEERANLPLKIDPDLEPRHFFCKKHEI